MTTVSSRNWKQKPHNTYLGIEDEDVTEHYKMKTINQEYKRKLMLVLNSELSVRNKKAAINRMAVPVVTYIYRVISWKLDEIQGLDKITRKHAKKADVQRICLTHQEGGGGPMSLDEKSKQNGWNQ